MQHQSIPEVGANEHEPVLSESSQPINIESVHDGSTAVVVGAPAAQANTDLPDIQTLKQRMNDLEQELAMSPRRFEDKLLMKLRE